MPTTRTCPSVGRARRGGFSSPETWMGIASTRTAPARTSRWRPTPPMQDAPGTGVSKSRSTRAKRGATKRSERQDRSETPGAVAPPVPGLEQDDGPLPPGGLVAIGERLALALASRPALRCDASMSPLPPQGRDERGVERRRRIARVLWAILGLNLVVALAKLIY